FIARDSILTGILGVDRLPPQSTLWRFLAGLHLNVAGQILKIQQAFRQRVWEAANVKLETVTLDTDTTVHTVYGKQMGARKSYNPKNKGKLSYQPILTFMAETREYLHGDLHNGDRHSGEEIANHIHCVHLSAARLGQGALSFGSPVRQSGAGEKERQEEEQENIRCQGSGTISIVRYGPLRTVSQKGELPIRRPLRGWLR